MIYDSVQKSTSMHLIEFKSAKHFEKTLFYPTATKEAKCCHKSNQLVGMNKDL